MEKESLNFNIFCSSFVAKNIYIYFWIFLNNHNYNWSLVSPCWTLECVINVSLFFRNLLHTRHWTCSPAWTFSMCVFTWQFFLKLLQHIWQVKLLIPFSLYPIVMKLPESNLPENVKNVWDEYPESYMARSIRVLHYGTWNPALYFFSGCLGLSLGQTWKYLSRVPQAASPWDSYFNILSYVVP